MGALPTTNLGINAINREGVVYQPWYAPPNLPMSGIGNSLSPYLPLGTDPYKISSYLGWQLPTAFVRMTQNDGGIWDGCHFWDTWCLIASDDPDWNGQGAFYGNFMYNSERGFDNGTFLTFGGGSVDMTVHGRNNIIIENWMEPQYTPFCTGVILEIRIDGVQVACVSPDPYNYTNCTYTIPSSDPGGSYKIECNVLYGKC